MPMLINVIINDNDCVDHILQLIILYESLNNKSIFYYKKYLCYSLYFIKFYSTFITFDMITLIFRCKLKIVKEYKNTISQNYKDND